MATGNINIATVIAITSLRFYLQFDLTNKTGLGLGLRARIDAMALQHCTTSSGELGALVLKQRDISSGCTLSVTHVDS